MLPVGCHGQAHVARILLCGEERRNTAKHVLECVESLVESAMGSEKVD